MTTGSNRDTRQSADAVALNRALNVIGDPWALQIIKESFLGVRRYKDFQEKLKIPRQTLMLRLNRMTDHSIFYKQPKQRGRVVYEYHLSPKGGDLYPFILMVWLWHKQWHMNQSQLPVELYHQTCGHRLAPQMVCGNCVTPFVFSDVDVKPGPGLKLDEVVEVRRARIVNELSALDENNLATVMLGDRWSILVLNAVLHGTHNYDQLRARLKISSNVLSLRLKTLQSLDLLAQRPNALDGRSYDYLVTSKGQDVYPMILALIQWADHWLAGSDGPPALFRHKTCNNFLEPRVVCLACDQQVHFKDVKI